MAIRFTARKRFALLALVGAVALSIGGAGAANAAPTSPPPPIIHGSGDHCSFNIDTNVMVCADQESQLASAVVAATGKEAVKADGSAKFSPQVNTVVGTIYSFPSYGGRSLDLVTSSNCQTSLISYTNLATIGWDNDIDSFKSYSGCKTTLWENTGFTGSKYGPYVDKTSIGVIANQASSITWGN